MTSHGKINTKKQYNEALKRFEKVFHAKAGTKESDEADLLSVLIKDYESQHFVFEIPDPIEAILYRMEQEGLSKTDLAKILGYKSRVSDILSKTRKLNVKMIRNLHEKLHIPLESLVKDY
jgi:HTH-type transcriptional regulator/antitoxin HigA